jgi:hypothetical protein
MIFRASRFIRRKLPNDDDKNGAMIEKKVKKDYLSCWLLSSFFSVFVVKILGRKSEREEALKHEKKLEK